MSYNIKIPIALSRDTGKLVNVKDVLNGLKCNCYCPNCLEDLMAVNQEIKQKAHFRHFNNTNCEFNTNFESYLHWLAKEVFRNIHKITLPAIKSTDLKHGNRLKLQKNLSRFLLENSLPNFINMHFDNSETSRLFNENIILQDSTSISISDCTTEKTLKLSDGDIRVDIVAIVDNHELFIEPFFSHKIDNIKLDKIKNLNRSIISIDLLKFNIKHQYEFSISDFEFFLANDLSSKKWVHIRDSKINNLILNLTNNVWPYRIEKIMELIKGNHLINQKILENSSRISILIEENQKLESKLKPFSINDLFGI